MASSDRSSPQPYSPANPPFTERLQDFSRATWDEFYRIAERFVSVDTPAAMAVTGTETCSVQAAVVWQRLLDGTKTYDWQQPDAQLDNATGIWNCPQEGLYNISIIVEIPAFPNPGNRIYTATLRSTGHPANGDPDRTVLSSAGGPDEAPLRLVANFLRPFNRGDQLWWDLDLTEEGYTGNVSVLSILSICRQSTAK